MAHVSPPPVMYYSPPISQQALPTPSPFTNSSLASLNSRSSQHSNIFLRFLACLFSVVSVFTFVASFPHKKEKGLSFNILDNHEFRYLFSIIIFASIYSASQLLKGINDIAFKGLLISDNICDHISLVFDQMVAYLLMSSISASVPAIRGMEMITVKRVVIVSVSFSFVAFLAHGVAALVSGYKLCKRIMW